MEMLFIVFSVLYGLLALLITGANILIIVVFSRRTLRKRSNILLVGSLAVPLLIARHFSSSVGITIASDYVDGITGLTSLFTLAMMSLERMYAIRWPFRHRTLIRRAYIFAACLPWILVSVGTLTARLAAIDGTVIRIFISSSLVLPIIIIYTAYYVIWKKQRCSSLYHQSAALQELAKERKLAKTILVSVGASVGTWAPFLVINVYLHVAQGPLSVN